MLSELIWGKEDKNQNGEQTFKVIHKGLEYDKSKVEPDLISFNEYLNNKYKLMSDTDYQKIEQKEKTLEEINREIELNRLKELFEITEPNHPGAKFRRFFEDMRKKLSLDAKIKRVYFPESNISTESDNKETTEINNYKNIDINQILSDKTKKFNELSEDAQDTEKYQYIFNNAYHRILLSFFTMMISLKKLKQDFIIIFRFFGSDESSINEFFFEYNNFIDGKHPRFCGEYGYSQFKLDVQKEKKEYKIDTKTEEFISVWYRGANENEERAFFETMQQPNFNEIEDIREAIEEYYQDENNQGNIQPCVGYKDIYLTFMEKISQNSSFCILDDYSYFIHNNNKHGKLFLIDPYDVDTLQIFFDIELDKYPEKIDVIDIVTQKQLSQEYYMNKYVVNVEPYKAIIDINYFSKKIEECIHNRISELIKMQAKDIPIIPNDIKLNFQNEMHKLPGDIYLEMTVLPLLQNAINMCDMIRPPDPITFIANFMLINKDKTKNLEDIIKELPKNKEEKKKEIELIINDDIQDEKFEEEKKEEEKKEEEAKEEKEKTEEDNKKKGTSKKGSDSNKKTKTKTSTKAKK